MTPEQETKLNEMLKERDDVIAAQHEEIEGLKTKFDGIVKFVNDFVKKSDQKVNAIDSVAFAAFAMHEDKADSFNLDATNVTETRGRIEKVLTNFNEFREALVEEAKKRAEKEAKKAAKKAEAQAKRDAKKGKTPKKAVTKDESTSTDESN